MRRAEYDLDDPALSELIEADLLEQLHEEVELLQVRCGSRERTHLEPQRGAAVDAFNSSQPAECRAGIGSLAESARREAEKPFWLLVIHPT